MSLLHQDSREEIDDAARGEAFTKGSSHLIWASIAAAVLVTFGIGWFVIAGERPPAAAGEVLEVWAHPMHVETSGLDANGAPMSKQSFDQVLIFAHVRLRNQSKDPLFLHEVLTNVSLGDGLRSSYAASAADFDRTFLVYPDLKMVHGKPLPTDATIDPGQSIEGNIVCSFRISKPEWEARKDLNFTFAFRYQPRLVLAPQAAVIEQ